MMKKTFSAVLLVTLLFFACATDEISEETVEELPVAEPVYETVISDEPEVIAVIQEDEPAAEEAPAEEEPAAVAEPEPEPEPAPVEEKNYSEEYLRSVQNLSGDDQVIVPPEVFESDKDEIFKVINELDQIMKTKDFNAWVNHLTPASYEYWSNRHNLLELSKHLFGVGDFKINNIYEYFEMFFIPARRGRFVDEIRYVTPTFVKVVQYKNKTDIIYYFFEKQDDRWLLQLDTL